MRVVAGVARGRRLVAPKGEATRPTSDFVREAVFATLGSYIDLEGATVLDLFAGTGALGIEALSRGAGRAVFVDHDRRAVAAIRANLASTGVGPGEVHQADVLRWLDRTENRPFDVVFADPPYRWDGWPELLGRLDGGLLVLEAGSQVALGDRFELLKVKRYGDTFVTLTTPRSRP
ncbi:MAG: 16S rRNA (guanine(966)-N(2))-methyltransferase RsmD [Actinobacteria bacterium]|nr:16S rRNA (guanine(966)-N(2))-methyltransferase RsmD [Actinomycetota bacterium]